VHRGTEPVKVEQRFGREDSGYADLVIHGRHRRPPRFAGKATVIPPCSGRAGGTPLGTGDTARCPRSGWPHPGEIAGG
jgi:hypothetical protein